MNDSYSKKNFLGQKSFFLPETVIQVLKQNGITEKFYLSELGYYPMANNHNNIEEKGVKDYTLIYCTNGKGSVTLKNKEAHIAPNQFFIIPKDTKYEYKSDGVFPWSIYWFNFNGSMASELYSRYEMKKSSKVSFSADRILLFEKIFDLFSKRSQEGSLEYAMLLSLGAISSIIYNDLDVQNHTKKEENLIISIKNFLSKHLDKNFSLEDLSRKYNYSKSHLQARFKAETGYSLLVFFNLKKIQQAADYLNCTDLSIKEISFKVGFQDPLYFSRVFKNFMGKSPSSYKKENQKQSVSDVNRGKK